MLREWETHAQFSYRDIAARLGSELIMAWSVKLCFSWSGYDFRFKTSSKMISGVMHLRRGLELDAVKAGNWMSLQILNLVSFTLVPSVLKGMGSSK